MGTFSLCGLRDSGRGSRAWQLALAQLAQGLLCTLEADFAFSQLLLQGFVQAIADRRGLDQPLLHQILALGPQMGPGKAAGDAIRTPAEGLKEHTAGAQVSWLGLQVAVHIVQEAAAVPKETFSGRLLDQGGAEPVLVIVGGLHMGPALVLTPGPLPSLRLLPGLSCLLWLPILCLPILQSDPLGLRLRQVIATRVSCLGFLAGLLLPFGFQEFMELLLGGEVSASTETGGRRICGRSLSPELRFNEFGGKGLRTLAPAYMLLLLMCSLVRIGQLPAWKHLKATGRA